MKKCYCDKCGKLIGIDGMDIEIVGKDQNSRTHLSRRAYDLCDNCGEKLLKWLHDKIDSTKLDFDS